jgi:hypothetical protein
MLVITAPALRTGPEHHQQAVTVSTVNQPVQRLDRLLIPPLRIVDHDQRRSVGADRVNKVPQPLRRGERVFGNARPR